MLILVKREYKFKSDMDAFIDILQMVYNPVNAYFPAWGVLI